MINTSFPINLETHNGILVLRDDLLPGGTKSILLDEILSQGFDEYVYATPVYGGFQLALSLYCKKFGKKAVLFCGKRKQMHANTVLCKNAGAIIYELPVGYLSVAEHHATKYCSDKPKAFKITFGAEYDQSVLKIKERMENVIETLGYEPDVVFCAIGSGTLIRGILQGTKNSIIHGVQVGKAFTDTHERLVVHVYPKSFDKISHTICPFPSMPNYDLKAWEYCTKACFKNKTVLFWNVL